MSLPTITGIKGNRSPHLHNQPPNTSACTPDAQRCSSSLPALSQGPVFLSGGQHSGNTVLTLVLAKVQTEEHRCYAQIDENTFFERATEVDQERESAKRIDQLMTLLRLEHAGAEQPIRESLGHMLGQNPGTSAIDMYLRAMHIATVESGNTFWAQKATSYIYYVDEIFRAIPDARMVFLLRNPYDICASRIRRDPNRDNVWAPMIAWNRALRIAHRKSLQSPDRFRIIKYEDMVSRDEQTIAPMFDALGIPFSRAVLDVPQVNKSSDGRYTLTPKEDSVVSIDASSPVISSAQRGLTKSRIYTYQETLSRAQLRAMDQLVDGALLDEYYPDVPHRNGNEGPRAGLGDRVRARAMIFVGPARFLFEKIRFHRKYGGSWRYIFKRLAHRAKR